MKTQIIRLEPHDDVISARDKMVWGQTGRILLVWPERGRVLARRLDLVLLQRHSTALGAQLALVTHDPQVRFYARGLAIPVFTSLRRAQRAHWRVPRRLRRMRYRRETLTLKKSDGEASESLLPPRPTSPPKPPSPATRLIFFTLGVLAMLSIAALLLPSAQVSLTPQEKSQEITLAIQGDPDLKNINLSGIVPLHETTVIVEGLDHLATTGSVLYPDQPATGSVLFTNITDQPVTIPEGSLVQTAGEAAIRFATTQAGTVPVGITPTLTLTVRALEPGSSGNLPGGSLIAFDSALGTRLTATNPQPTRGGTDIRSPAPSANDRRRLKDQLFNSLRQTALSELENGLSQGDMLLTSTLVLSSTLEEKYEPAENQPANQLSLSLRLEFKAQTASGEDLRQLATAVLDANLPAGFNPVPDSLEIQSLTQPETESARWKLLARRQLQAKLPENQAVQLSLGLPPTQAERRLASALPLENPPHITLTPYWWPRLPILPFRVTVVAGH